jgi:c-di-GMP-binding flagellar brake protein YcgR
VTDERRQYSRIPLLLTVIWEGAAGKYEARTSDISVGGCFVDSIGQVAAGEIISFKLQLPAGEWLNVQGEVKYPLPPAGFGVRFINLSEADQKRIELLTRTGT